MSQADDRAPIDSSSSAAVLSQESPQPPTPDASRWQRFRHWLATPNDKYTVGTLKYTGFGLMMMFIWLLWGDFIFTLLDGNIPGILPLKLSKMGASDTVNNVLIRSFGYTVVFLFAPWVSFKSDRTRTRWGRRIPYLTWSTPFVGLFLVLIGCYENLTSLLTGGAASVQFLGLTIGSGTLTLIVFGALLVGYDFANIFVNTVYWYLFNDVVPSQYLSRFLSLFRIVGILANMLYSKWIFPHSLDRFRLLFVVAGIAYVVGFTLMCVFVREGSYPPPPQNVDKGQGFISSMKTFARECFTHRLYWYFFLWNTGGLLMGQLGTFKVVRNTGTLGISMADLGAMGFWTGWISLVLQYPAGWVADRWNPIRVQVFANLVGIFGTLAECVWMFKDFGPHGNLVFMYVISLIFMPIGAIGEASGLPMYMRLLPKDRYGQFCSANAMIRAFAMIFGAPIAGAALQSLDTFFHLGAERYRYIPLWVLIWQIPTILFLLLLYRQWKQLGADHHYVPPGVSHAQAQT